MVLTFGYLLLALFVVLTVVSCLVSKKVIPDFGHLIVVFFVALGATALISWFSADVTIIHSDKSHDKYLTFGAPSFDINGEEYTLEDLKMFSSYIVNETDGNLILYPVCYGDAKVDMTKYKACLIGTGMYNEVDDLPDYYFEEPESINVSENFIVSIFKKIFGLDYEIKWIVDEYKGE